MTTLAVSRAGKTMRENPTFEIPSELVFDMGWTGCALAANAGEFEPGDEFDHPDGGLVRRFGEAVDRPLASSDTV